MMVMMTAASSLCLLSNQLPDCNSQSLTCSECVKSKSSQGGLYIIIICVVFSDRVYLVLKDNLVLLEIG